MNRATIWIKNLFTDIFDILYFRSLVDVVYALRDEVQELKQVSEDQRFFLIFKFIENYI